MMKTTRHRHTVFLLYFTIGIAALVSTSDQSFLFSVIFLSAIVQIIIFFNLALKRLFNIPNITVVKNKLIYRGVIFKRVFDIDELAIEHLTYAEVRYYTITSSDASVSIPEFNISETEKKILSNLVYQKNSELVI